MKKIRGWVCIVQVRSTGPYSFEWLFGPSVYNQPYCYENIQSNGLLPFSTRTAAQGARKALRERNGGTKLMGLGRIQLEIAETPQEVEKISKSRRLILIQHEDGETVLVGSAVKGRQDGVLPGARLCLNGYRTIKSLETARYIKFQRGRQVQCPVELASFSLKRLKT